MDREWVEARLTVDTGLSIAGDQRGKPGRLLTDSTIFESRFCTVASTVGPYLGSEISFSGVPQVEDRLS